jgi:hypothetical protein
MDPALLTNGNFTGPVGTILLVVMYLIKQYMDSKDDNRKADVAERESETGVVETSRATLQTVREQMEAMRQDARVLRAETDERDKEQVQAIRTLRQQVERLLDDNRRLRIQLGLPPFDPDIESERIFGRHAGMGRPGSATGPNEGGRRRRGEAEGGGRGIPGYKS